MGLMLGLSAAFNGTRLRGRASWFEGRISYFDDRVSCRLISLSIVNDTCHPLDLAFHLLLCCGVIAVHFAKKKK